MDIGVQDVIQLGVGFAVAFIIMTWKRADDKSYMESLKAIIEKQDANEDKMIAAIAMVTEAANNVSEALESFINLHALVDKISAIERRLADGSTKSDKDSS